MALRQGGGEVGGISIESPLSKPSLVESPLKKPSAENPLKKYRESRDKPRDDVIETKTRRRVVRMDENGNEEVTVRDRNLVNTNTEEVKRDVERTTRNFDVSLFISCLLFFLRNTSLTRHHWSRSWDLPQKGKRVKLHLLPFYYTRRRLFFGCLENIIFPLSPAPHYLSLW